MKIEPGYVYRKVSIAFNQVDRNLAEKKKCRITITILKYDNEAPNSLKEGSLRES